MREITKRASASKETLDAWFDDERGLFEAIILHNVYLSRRYDLMKMHRRNSF